jgi:2-dehydro-3-deoxyphosphooctonate aldolase (KDO 8-P synthase)
LNPQGNEQIILTERGFTLGYNDLVVDPRSFYHLQETGYPVVFDVTHSIRKYGIPSADPSGGARQYLEVLGRAGVWLQVWMACLLRHTPVLQKHCVMPPASWM